MGEKHEQQPLQSINNDHRSFVKFINSTQRNVTLYWIDYQGQAISYGIMTPGDTKDINTFVTHPWIFVDDETRDRYVVNQKDVFFPEPWFVKYPELRQSEMPQRSERTRVHITLRIYTLRELTLRATRSLLTHHRQAYQLDIPRSLQNELAVMLRAEEDANGDDEGVHL